MSDASVIKNKNAQAESNLSTSSSPDEPHYPWFQYYEPGVPTHLEIPDHPLTWLLDCTASRYSSHTAFIYYGTRISYAQFASYANRFAVALQRLGVKKGDRVAIALPNIPQYPIAFYGVLKAGAVVVPTNPLYTEHEMQYQFADAGARVIVMLDSFYPIVRRVRGQTALEHVIVTSPADFFPTTLRILYPLSQRNAKYPEPRLTAKELHDDPTLHEMHTMLESRNSEDVEQFHLPVPLLSSDLAVLQYTGGTTGLAKGAMLTQRNLLSNAIQARSWCPQAVDGKEITLCVAPFFHSYGLTVGLNYSILIAATMVLLPRFKSKEVMTAIRKYRPTMFPGIPTMYIALIREVGKHTEHMRSIKYCISGAAPLPAKVQADFEAVTHGKLVEGYGLSEASPVTHANPLTEQSRNGSIGLPLPNVEATILHQQTGQPLAVGETGEIAVKGPNIMPGYWNRQQETEAIFTSDGWMRTGDIGKMDADGYFYVVERAKDLIIVSGFNVYPHEVEEVLFQHPTVSEAAVVGVHDEYRGETVAAFVVLKPGVEPSEETKQELLDYCKQYLAAYKVPKKLAFRASLPKSIIGKVLRRELRAS
jgi:long-chain acyl-CoA synthetase